MFKTPVRNIFGNPIKSGDDEAPLSSERIGSVEQSPETDHAKFFLFSSNKEEVDYEAEIEIIKSDLEAERETVEELRKQLEAKDRSIEHSNIRITNKRDENKELKQKIAELESENTKLAEDLKGLLYEKLDSEKNLTSQVYEKDTQLKTIKSKFDKKLKYYEGLIKQRHASYKEKENSFKAERLQSVNAVKAMEEMLLGIQNQSMELRRFGKSPNQSVLVESDNQQPIIARLQAQLSEVQTSLTALSGRTQRAEDLSTQRPSDV